MMHAASIHRSSAPRARGYALNGFALLRDELVRPAGAGMHREPIKSANGESTNTPPDDAPRSQAYGAAFSVRATRRKTMRMYRAFCPPIGKPPIKAQSCCDEEHQSIRTAVRCRWRTGREDLPIVAFDTAGVPQGLTEDEALTVLYELEMIADHYAEAAWP